MNAIPEFGRNKVAPMRVQSDASADNDARGAAPVNAGSLVPPPKPPQESRDGMARSACIVSSVVRGTELHEPDSERQAAALADSADRTATEALLFLLELAKTTGDLSFVEVASIGAKQLVEGWSRTEAKRMAVGGRTDSAKIDNLSRAAFALAEAWTITQNPAYRDAGLSILRYLAGAQPAAYAEADSRIGAQL